MRNICISALRLPIIRVHRQLRQKMFLITTTISSEQTLQNLDWGFFFEDVDDLGQVLLSPGNTITCGKAVLVNKGFAPYTYRIQTGKNTYSWFTTAR